MYQDKELVCKDCGKTFIFTAGEQEFYAEKGFQNEPQRCKECRAAKKAAIKSSKRILYRHLRQLRRRGESSLPAQRRQTCILQRMLLKNERSRIIFFG